MKRFRKFTIVWGIILVAIFVLFTMYSFKLDKKIKKYHDLEEYFATSVAEYNNAKKDYPQTLLVLSSLIDWIYFLLIMSLAFIVIVSSSETVMAFSFK